MHVNRVLVIDDVHGNKNENDKDDGDDYNIEMDCNDD